MRFAKLASLLSLLTGLLMPAHASTAPKVLIETSLGTITVELDAEKAPKTVENFLQYVKDKHYDGLVFHRIIPDFMIQGGGYDAKSVQKATRKPVQNEAKNGLSNLRGSIAMARTNDPHSATSQFFINHADNVRLDYPSFDGWGYTVFGKVVSGIEVVDKIAETPTGPLPPFGRDVPLTPVVIQRITLAE